MLKSMTKACIGQIWTKIFRLREFWREIGDNSRKLRNLAERVNLQTIKLSTFDF